MLHKRIRFIAVALACLLSFHHVTYTSAILGKQRGDDGKDRVIVHDEAVIPTHTVTQIATETAIKTHTIEKQTVATPMPEVNTYCLHDKEPLPITDNNKILLKREVIDIFIRNGTYVSGAVRSGAKTIILHPLTIVLSSVTIFIFMLT